MNEEQKIKELKSSIIKMKILNAIQNHTLATGQTVKPEFLDALKNAPLIRDVELVQETKGE